LKSKKRKSEKRRKIEVKKGKQNPKGQNGTKWTKYWHSVGWGKIFSEQVEICFSLIQRGTYEIPMNT
jgi:hypothetical protein